MVAQPLGFFTKSVSDRNKHFDVSCHTLSCLPGLSGLTKTRVAVRSLSKNGARGVHSSRGRCRGDEHSF